MLDIDFRKYKSLTGEQVDSIIKMVKSDFETGAVNKANPRNLFEGEFRFGFPNERNVEDASQLYRDLTKEGAESFAETYPGFSWKKKFLKAVNKRKTNYTWDDFDRFHNSNALLPNFGDGDSMGTQAATALSKLVYKWFNDGDVYDDSFFKSNFSEDISGSANWLSKYIDGAEDILSGIYQVTTDGEYTELLFNLCSVVDPQILDLLREHRRGDAYDEKVLLRFWVMANFITTLVEKVGKPDHDRQ